MATTMAVATMVVATTHLQEVVEMLVVMQVETQVEETPTHLPVVEMTQGAETQVVEMLGVEMLTHLQEVTMLEVVVMPEAETWVAMPEPRVETKPLANQLQTMQ